MLATPGDVEKVDRAPAVVDGSQAFPLAAGSPPASPWRMDGIA